MGSVTCGVKGGEWERKQFISMAVFRCGGRGLGVGVHGVGVQGGNAGVGVHGLGHRGGGRGAATAVAGKKQE